MISLFGPRSGRFPRHHRAIPSSVEVGAELRGLHHPGTIRVV